MKIRWYLLSAALVAMAIIGCGGEREKADVQVATPARTPQELFVNMQAALAANDHAAVIACFDLTGAQKPAFEAKLNLADASAELAAKAMTAFGEGAPARLRIGNPFHELTSITVEDCIFVDGEDTAVFVTPEGEELSLVKVDGGWLFDMAGMPTDEADLARDQAVIDAMAAVLRDLVPEVDAEGMTLDAFEEILAERLMTLIVEQKMAEAQTDAAPEPGTPQRAMFDLIDALHRTDRDAVVGSYAVEGKQAQVLGEMFDFRQLIAEFEARVSEVFGQTAVSYFRSTTIPFEATAVSRLRDYTFEEDGDTVTITSTRGGDDRMRRVDGVWKFDLQGAADFPQTDEQCDRVMVCLALRSQMYRELLAEIDKEGMTQSQMAQLAGDRWRVVTAKEIRLILPPREGSAAQDAIDALKLPVADTPEQTMANIRTALLTGNRGGFVAAYDVDGDHVELLADIFDMTQAGRAFEMAVVEVFGDEGAAVLGESFEAAMAAMAADEIVIDDDGEHATGSSAAGPDIPLTRVGGVWKVDMPDMPTGEADLEMTVTIIQMLRTIYNEMAKEARVPGMTLEQLETEISIQMMQVKKLQMMQMQQIQQGTLSDEALLPLAE